jgi:hypothetical protein
MRPRLSLPFALLLTALFALLASSGTAEAQAPRRRGKPEAIRAAGAAFTAGVAGVSRNESAFIQDVVLNGCEVSVTSRRKEKADSLVELQLFDAGHMSARSTMSVDATTGAIMFRFPTVSGAPRVTRTRYRTLDVETGNRTGPNEEKGSVAELLLLVANTSRQPDAQAFLTGWIDFVDACGGEPAT